jgi:hypothetical protein
VAENVAVGTGWLHDHLDRDALGAEPAQDAQHEEVLGRSLPADGLKHAPVGAGERRDHVDLRDVDGEDQVSAQLGR